MSPPKSSRKSPSPPAGAGVDEKSSALPRGDGAAKPAKPPRKRRPRFVL